MSTRLKSVKKLDMKSKIIKRQVDEIESLKNKISSLEIDCSEKEDIIKSIDVLRIDFDNVIAELKEKRKEYDIIISDLKKMRSVMNREVFNGKWKIIKMLMR